MKGVSPATHPLLDQLAGYAVRYYTDFVKPRKKYRLADAEETAALNALSNALKTANADATAEDAERFRQGVHATLYLSPTMYHRVHSPVDGRVVSWRYVPGRLFPVNASGVRLVPGLFTRNERVAVLLETEAHGTVAVVLVGAANVGRMRTAITTNAASTLASPTTLARDIFASLKVR